MAEKESSHTYWAREEDAGNFIQEVLERRKRFQFYFQQTALFERVRRSYLFYHNQFDSADPGGSISVAGEESELRKVSANHYRSTIDLLKTFVVAGKPEWDSIATSSDYQALEATKLSNDVLDAYMGDVMVGTETAVSDAVEHGLVQTAGYCWPLFDTSLGEEVDVDQETETLMYSGEFRMLTPGLDDVAYDHHADSYNDSEWVLVRRRVSKYSLAAQHPELEDEIFLTQCVKNDGFLEFFEFDTPPSNDEDGIWVYTFYHKRTPAIPNGRVVHFFGSEHFLEDRELKEKMIPVRQYCPKKYEDTPFGNSPALDVQGAQEALNGMLSILLTNAAQLGLLKLWKRPGSPIDVDQLEGGITVIETPEPPQSLNFLQSAPELFKNVDLYGGIINQLMGVAEVSRGIAAPNIKTGALAALMDSRTTQAASDMIRSYRVFLSEVGTAIIHSLAGLASGSRLLATVGAKDGRFLPEFQAELLKPVTKVQVTTGNPLTSTAAGRAQLAEYIIQSGALQGQGSAGLYALTEVLLSGNIKPITDIAQSQYRSANAENDQILRGQDPMPPHPTDNHQAHIQTHAVLFDARTLRMNPEVTQRALAHMGMHQQMMMDPQWQPLQVALGFMAPMGPPAPAQGPGGAPPSPTPPGQPGAPTGANTQPPNPDVPESVAGRISAAESAAGQ